MSFMAHGGFVFAVKPWVGSLRGALRLALVAPAKRPSSFGVSRLGISFPDPRAFSVNKGGSRFLSAGQLFCHSFSQVSGRWENPVPGGHFPLP